MRAVKTIIDAIARFKVTNPGNVIKVVSPSLQP